LRGIAERAGTTLAVLQHHFVGKDELLAAVLAQRDAEEHEAGMAEVHGLDELAPYLSDLLLRHQKAPELMRLWVELAVAASRPGHPAHDYFADRQERVRALLADSLHEQAPQGKLAEGLDPDSGALLFYAMLNGLQILWLLNPRLDIVAPLNRFMELVFPPERQQRG
jgi:AcrR family transcriptional regulator